MNNISLDTITRTYSNKSLANALTHNAAVIQFASTVIVHGTIEKKAQSVRVMKGFEKIHDQYQAENIKIIEEFEKAIETAVLNAGN